MAHLLLSSKRWIILSLCLGIAGTSGNCLSEEKKPDLQLFAFYLPLDEGQLTAISLVIVNRSSRNWTVLTHPNIFFTAIPTKMNGFVPKGTKVGVAFYVSQMPEGLVELPDLPTNKLFALARMHVGKDQLPLFSKPSLTTGYPVELKPGEATEVWGNDVEVSPDQKVEEIEAFYEVAPLWSHFYPSVWSGKLAAKLERQGSYRFETLELKP